MKNKKTFVLMISKTFPRSHNKTGLITNFKQSIEDGTKLHTIRKNAKLWAKRAEQINAGEAVLSVREWKGKPYHSKQNKLFLYEEIGTEFINIKDPINIPDIAPMFAQNDGLSINDFNNWFDFKVDETYIIIHFTNFRYAKQHENN